MVWLATVCRVVGDKAKEFSSGGRVAEDAGEVVGEGKGGGDREGSQWRGADRRPCMAGAESRASPCAAAPGVYEYGGRDSLLRECVVLAVCTLRVLVRFAYIGGG